MPFRGVLPKLSAKFSSKPSTASVFSPPSAGSSKAVTPHPMTPPARLHLRSILPTSPDCLPTPPLPPPTPRPWIWQCHGCLTIWRLASTRRCLVCSHKYCTTTTQLTGRGRGKKRRRGNGALYCRAEFDYQGWDEWGAWRREVLGREAVQRSCNRAFLDREHDCWLDCDYPSQCHHERAQLATVAAAAESSAPARPHPDDDNLQMNEALSLDVAQDHPGGQQKSPPASPKSPLSQTSFFSEDEPDKEESTTQRNEQKAWWMPAEEHSSQVARGSPAVDAGAMDLATLECLIRDEVLIPLDHSSHEGYKSSGSGRGRLTVRNSTERDERNSLPASPPSSSSSPADDHDSLSDDSDEYELAETDLSSAEEDNRTLEEIERGLRELIEASKSYLRE
ncbi:hypothetical protein DL766_002913 [Monosporascus sp. MC13-8B]|uniref:FYVE zinc finger domain-containing protein n=1 Tax=Monosporascus cannonballus TaxID=155416 RepID=A0ABY0HCL3_9PEZI|nr:hypothetical protein DL763_008194 [Monosporascus cannonballus]RYO87549.1 hypothetical protein DL762_004195 [Monosporascus cannonballus]RYP34546.1 hypothetical protein DL766_002913 [Monosporascus sp. MC13-8B]